MLRVIQSAGLLAAINWEQAGVFLTGIIAVLGGQKGLEALFIAYRGRLAGKGVVDNDGRKSVSQVVCDLRHSGLERLMEERHATIQDDLSEIKAGINRLQERVDKLRKG
jgi:hypothetical protein